jgi:serine-type D-Ala-D-Ala carboxypeptidase (penicillin-binding protein 5/6)
VRVGRPSRQGPRLGPAFIVTLSLLAAAVGLAPSSGAAPPRVDARAWLVQNARTGEVLASHDARRRVAIASITKLMTVLVTLEHARLDDVVRVSPEAAAVGESSIGLQAGELITVRALIEAALIQSANDAAYALAAHVGGGDVDRFVAMMNTRARRLGLTDTHFVRPDGLDAPGHVSSARDVTLLARTLMRRPFVRDVVRRRSAVAAGRTLRTWNDLLGRFPGLFGVKTGHTSEAGWSEVAAVRRTGLVIYAAILGSPGRSERNAALVRLLRYGISRYRLVEAIAPRHVYARARTGYGLEPVALVASRPAIRAVRVDRPLVERVVAATAIDLPVRQGQRLGEVRVYAGGRLLAHRDLVAARAVERPGLVRRVRWYAGRTLHNLIGFVT